MRLAGMPMTGIRGRKEAPMLRSLVLTLTLLTPLAATAADWTPNAWTEERTVDLTTVAPAEGAHTFPVWFVVLDGQVYVRLGSRAAGRIDGSTTKPYVGVTIAGQHFDKVKGDPAPDMAARVGTAMGEKYWSDVLIKYFSHPLTLRLAPD